MLVFGWFLYVLCILINFFLKQKESLPFKILFLEVNSISLKVIRNWIWRTILEKWNLNARKIVHIHKDLKIFETCKSDRFVSKALIISAWNIFSRSVSTSSSSLLKYLYHLRFLWIHLKCEIDLWILVSRKYLLCNMIIGKILHLKIKAESENYQILILKSLIIYKRLN